MIHQNFLKWKIFLFDTNDKFSEILLASNFVLSNGKHCRNRRKKLRAAHRFACRADAFRLCAGRREDRFADVSELLRLSVFASVARLSRFIFCRDFAALALEKRKDYFYFAVFSLFGVILNQLLFFQGLSLTTAVNTSLLAVTDSDLYDFHQHFDRQ